MLERELDKNALWQATAGPSDLAQAADGLEFVSGTSHRLYPPDVLLQPPPEEATGPLRRAPPRLPPLDGQDGQEMPAESDAGRAFAAKSPATAGELEADADEGYEAERQLDDPVPEDEGAEEPPDGHEEEEWSPSTADPRRRLEYGEDNQPAFRGSFVKVPDGEEYLPKGVWRPEDNLMCEPEREA